MIKNNVIQLFKWIGIFFLSLGRILVFVLLTSEEFRPIRKTLLSWVPVDNKVVARNIMEVINEK